ncbi:dihydrofolate reductase [Candidatus Parcubacteria bacterium]|nr:MAG: dihydrofolate reductase [Candidatus Parcubacteria bacterium]
MNQPGTRDDKRPASNGAGKPVIAAVVAIGKNRELGKNGKLLWHIPDDLKRFKELTMGHPVIMGRKTFESIVGYIGGPLPGRTNIVITHHPEMFEIVSRTSGVKVVETLEEALERAKEAPGSEEIHIGGGAQLYEQALPMIDKLYLTLIDAAGEADTFFPPYEDQFTKKTFEEEHEWKGIKYKFIDLERA